MWRRIIAAVAKWRGGSDSNTPQEGTRAMASITKVCVGESLVGDGNEVAHIDLILGPRGSAAETAFCNALTNNKDGFTTLLAIVAPNLPCKPNTILYNKVTIKGAKQAVQMFGPAQTAVARAVADSVAEGVIPQSEAADLFITLSVREDFCEFLTLPAYELLLKHEEE